MTVTGAPATGVRGVEIRRVLLRMLLLSVVLGVMKSVVAWHTGSLAVLGGAVDSGVDFLTTLFSIALTGVAAQEPDELHPYGHGKFEAIGALAIVAFLSVTVFELIRGSVSRLLAPPTPVDPGPGLVVMGVSLVVGWVASVYERRKGHELRSEVLRADAAHLRADVYVTTAVLIGLGLTQAGFPRADAWVTLLVALLIALSGWGIILDAVPLLVDERAVEEEEIRRLACACEGVGSVHGVRSRGKQGEIFAELTVMVAPSLSVIEAHEIADRVESRLRGSLSAREIVVHVEPEAPAATEPA